MINVLFTVSMCILCAAVLVMLCKYIRVFAACNKEGILAVKLKFTKGILITAAASAVIFVTAGHNFSRANEISKNAKNVEGYLGTDYVEDFARQDEQKFGIEITDPDVYYQNMANDLNANAGIYTKLAVLFLVLGVELFLLMFGNLIIITKIGCRTIRMKYSVPVFAHLDNSKNQIVVMINDLRGKAERLLTFKATPKNLSALGEIINHEDLQEETQ